MVRAGGVARGRADALVLLGNQRLVVELFLGYVGPELLAHPFMDQFGEGLGKAIGQRLHHDGVVVVALGLVGRRQLLDAVTGGDREATDPVRLAAVLRGDEVGQAVADSLSVLGGLLANMVQTLDHLAAGLVGIDFDDVVIDAVGGPQANDPARLNQAFVDQLAQHHLGLVEQLACGFADHLVVEDLRILADQLPAHEEGRPVDTIDQFVEVVVLEHLETGKGRRRRGISLPVQRRLARPGIGVGQVGGLGAALGVALADLDVLFPDLVDVGLFQPR